MSYSVYVLRSERNGRFYIGYSVDLVRRLAEHNAGLVRATRYLTPWEIVYTEEFQDETSARKREYKLKSLKSRAYIIGLVERSG